MLQSLTRMKKKTWQTHLSLCLYPVPLIDLLKQLGLFGNRSVENRSYKYKKKHAKTNTRNKERTPANPIAKVMIVSHERGSAEFV